MHASTPIPWVLHYCTSWPELREPQVTRVLYYVHVPPGMNPSGGRIHATMPSLLRLLLVLAGAGPASGAMMLAQEPRAPPAQAPLRTTLSHDTKEALQGWGCRPDCRGTCFAGHCLFSGRNLDEAFLSGSPSSVQLGRAVAPAVAPADQLRLAELRAPELPPADMLPQVPGRGDDGLERSSSESQAAEIERLARENRLLQKELDGWRRIGGRVVEREARISEALAATRAKAGEPAVDMMQVLAGGAAASGDLERSTEAALEVAPRCVIALLELALLAAAVGVTWQLWSVRGQEKQMAGDQEPRPGCGLCFAPVGRCLGVVGYQVEVSELRLGSLGLARLFGELSISIQVGRQELRTRRAPTSDAGFYFFPEALQLQVGRLSGPCVFAIYTEDGMQRERIAVAQVAASTLIKSADDRGEYFRLDLCLEGGRWGVERGEVAPGRRPHLTMRLRDLGADSEASAVVHY